MAQLVQMKQQIRAIETIKKITHAMRLISMSAHSKMGNKINNLQNYKNELSKIINIIDLLDDKSIQDKLTDLETPKKTLIILVASQKGLAGNFNSNLFRFFERNNSVSIDHIEYISVGKKAGDFLRKKNLHFKNFDNFNLQNFYSIAKSIFEIIKKNNYTDIIIYANYSKSFFIQLPEKNIILPIKINKTKNVDSLITENYIWEQPIPEIYKSVTNEYINFSVQSILFNSLFAEQSARFNSMDSATRNAEELLENLKRQYNKLRQAKITKEIAEISSAL